MAPQRRLVDKGQRENRTWMEVMKSVKCTEIHEPQKSSGLTVVTTAPEVGPGG